MKEALQGLVMEMHDKAVVLEGRIFLKNLMLHQVELLIFK